ncbi:POM121-like protein 2 [Ochotona princeps]|uniref:POM121-like protein 2 n=1 Tax=Ochotona princeps TaxID=9978 RepID=UPI0027153C7E|nr:POM121-like protein 2 [Ochotona princeps]
MGSYLGKADPSPWSSSQKRTDQPEGRTNRRPSPPLYQVHRVQHVHCAHSAPQHRPARRLPHWDPAQYLARRVNEAWRRFPMRRASNSFMRPLPSDWWDSYCKRTIWSLRHPRSVCSPVTVKISPPERKEAPAISPANFINSAGPLASEETPDPRAKETVLRALHEYGKGRRKTEGPPVTEGARPKKPEETRLSAFKPLVKSGMPPCFVPRRGPLKRSRQTWGSDLDLNRRPGLSSLNSLAGTHPGPLSSKRNAISSSYSSSRYLEQPWRSRILRASLQSPEWPLKRKGQGHQLHSPAPLDSGFRCWSAPGPSGSPLRLPSSGNLLPGPPPPWRGQAGADKDGLDVGKGAGLPGSQGTGKEAAVHGTDEPGTKAAPIPDAGSQLQSSEDVRERPGGPPASPQAIREAGSVAPSPLAPLGCSHSATVTGMTPITPQDPAAGVTPRVDRADAGPAVLDTQSAPSGLQSSPVPQLLELVPAPSADLTRTPAVEPPSDSGEGDSIYSGTRVLPATTLASPSLGAAPGSTTPTFKPIFGNLAPLTTATAPAASQNFPVASSNLFHGLVKATSVVMSTSLTSALAGSPVKPPSSLSATSVAGALGNPSPVPPPWHTLLLGTTQVLKAGFSGDAEVGCVAPPPPQPAMPPVHTVTIFSQVTSGSSPLSASSLVPTLAPSASSPSSVFTAPLGSSLRPSFPLLAGSAPLPTRGVTIGQKRGLCQSGVDSESTLATPGQTAPTQPTLGNTLQPVAFGGSATLHSPASLKPLPPLSPCSSPGLGGRTQKQGAGAGGPVFGSTAPRPFAFGGLVTPMDYEESGPSPAAPVTGSAGGPLSAGALPSGVAGSGFSFEKSWRQNTSGLPDQSSPFALGRSNVPARHSTLGMASASPFAQSTPFFFGQGQGGSGLGFPMPSPTAQDLAARGPFGSALPSFSMGAKSKTPKKWGQAHSRRHRAHRK